MENDLAYFDVQTITKSSKRGGAELAEDIAEFLALPQGEVASGRHGPSGEQGPPPGDLPLRVPWTKGGKMPTRQQAGLAHRWRATALNGSKIHEFTIHLIFLCAFASLREAIFTPRHL